MLIDNNYLSSYEYPVYDLGIMITKYFLFYRAAVFIIFLLLTNLSSSCLISVFTSFNTPYNFCLTLSVQYFIPNFNADSNYLA